MLNEDQCAGIMRLLERARELDPMLGTVVKYEVVGSGELIVSLSNGTVRCTALMASDEGAVPNCVPPICIRGIAESFRPNGFESNPPTATY